MVEHAAVNRVVVGSSPTSGAIKNLPVSFLKYLRGPIERRAKSVRWNFLSSAFL